MTIVPDDNLDGEDQDGVEPDSSDRDGVEGSEGDKAEPSEQFTRYQNSVYRLISMGGAAIVAVIGITGFAIGRTLDPIPPAQFFFVDGIVAFVLFGWYLLGMRCHLDVAETWVHVATKYGDFRIDRSRIDAIEPDLSLRGTLQWSGRPLVIHYRVDDSGDKTKTRKAYGCLPNDAQTQQRAIGELQEALGRIDDSRLADLDSAVAGRLATMDSDPEAPPALAQTPPALSDAVAARLATMEPEGDSTSG